MAPSIVRLPPETASLIAAGEVVERPVSALKELLENALDAGANNVQVNIEQALDSVFQVADDGRGMTAAELPLALERHATSKLRDISDLDRLASLGFRGEALPSIAAVSRLCLTSRGAGERSGAYVACEGGARVRSGEAARGPGTTVEVRDLFFNTPARRKFLRSPAGELRAALRLMECYALAFPEVAFELRVDGREKLAVPVAGTRRERIASLLGARVAEQWLEACAERGDYRLHALLALPEQGRATREGQAILVNRRWIQSPLLGQALRQAYGDLLPAGRFPSAVLWLDVPPDRLDVNVHPTKREVRFAEESRVFELVAAPCAQRLSTLHPPFQVARSRPADPEPSWGDRVREAPPPQTYLPFAAPLPGSPVTAPAPTEAAREEPMLWQLHRTYILAPVRNGLVIVDQHAAHERILYEEARARLEGERGPSQQLLFPLLVDVSRDRFELLVELAPSLRQLGWELMPLGSFTIVIQGTPSDLRSERPGQLLQDILDGVAENSRDAHREISDRLARSYACHAAVKAGEPLTTQEMQSLLDQLFATTLPHGDPHGRPTFVRLEMDELHRRFGRL